MNRTERSTTSAVVERAVTGHRACERSLSGTAVRLRELRDHRGWTRQELAERAGVSKEAIYTHERGRKHPRRDTLCLLAEALGVSPADLIVERARAATAA
jgi:DNA-binding XRE family transcriptional regulator